MSRVLDFNDGFTSVSQPSGSANYFATHDVSVAVAENSVITLLNSGNYVVGRNQLYISLNGQLLELGVDYAEVGAANSISTQIMILQDLVVGDRLTIRK